jgi:hypothetical protein
MAFVIKVNGKAHGVDVDGDTPLLWVRRDVLGMTGRRFGCGLLPTILLSAVSLLAAESAEDIKPPVDHRNWFHVNSMVVDKSSPLAELLGGLHMVHVNSTGEAALKKGGPYPDKTVFVDRLHEFTVSEGSYVQGPVKSLAIMMKDGKKYAATGGWAFQAWTGADPKKPLVTDATKQCFECHQARKEKDYVYSTYIP